MSQSPSMPAAVSAPAGVLWASYVIVLVTTIIWGGTNVVAKLSLTAAPVTGLAAVRFAVASLFFALLLALTEREGFRPRLADLPRLAVLGLTGVTGSNLLFFHGLTLAPVADAALIGPATTPLWTALAAAVMLGERYGRRHLAGMGLSLLGVLVIVGAAGLDQSGGPQRLWGDSLMMAGAACWAVYTVLGRQALRRHSALAASTLSSIIGTVPMLIMAAPGGWDWLPQAGPPLWLGILYLALLGTVTALLTWHRAVRDLGAARAAQFTYLAPLWSLLLAAALLGERPTLWHVVGGALVIGGLWVTNRAPTHRRPGSDRALGGTEQTP